MPHDHPSNYLRLSNSEPDLTLQLSLGGGASTTPVGGQAPIPNGVAGDQKGKAILINQYLRPAAMKRSFDAAAGRRQLMSWKKRAREFGNGGQLIMPPAEPQQVLTPPPAPHLPRAAHHNMSAFRRAVSVIKSGIYRHRASHNSTTIMAPPKEFMRSHPNISTTMRSRKKVADGVGNYVEPVKHKFVELDAPRTMNTNHMLKSTILYGQSSYHQVGSPSKSTTMNIAPSSNYMVIYGQSSHQEVGSPSKKAKHVSFSTMAEDEIEQIIKVMPTVTTTGDLPNGRKIEGVLFKYLQGKVWIVCVCHGNLLSPEEFVQHAGGSDLTNAMRLIKVVRS